VRRGERRRVRVEAVSGGSVLVGGQPATRRRDGAGAREATRRAGGGGRRRLGERVFFLVATMLKWLRFVSHVLFVFIVHKSGFTAQLTDKNSPINY
jgi:hypothetical protein